MMRRGYWLILVFGAATLLRAAETPESRLSFADGLFRRGIYDLALREYFQFLQDQTNHPMTDAVWFRCGECYRALGNPASAERAYSRVTGASGGPWKARAALRRSELKREAGQMDEAMALLREVLAAQPPAEEAAEALFRLGDALEKAGRPLEAIPCYEQLAARYSNSVYAAYAQLAEGTLRVIHSNEVARGETLLKNAAVQASDPRVAAEAWYQLGMHYYRAGQYHAGAHAFDQLLTRYGDDPRSHAAGLTAAWTFHRAGQPADALRLAEKALAQKEESQADTWLYLAANSERALEKHDAAAARYATLLERYPTSPLAPRAALERAMALFAAGRYADAAAQCRTVDPSVPEADRLLWIQAECAAQLGDDDRAVQFYRTLADRYPASEWAPEALYRVGDRLRKRGDMSNAAETFRMVHVRYPQTALAPKALFAAAYAASQTNRLEDAIRDWGLLVEQYSAHPLASDALFQKAMTEARLGKHEQALETYGLLLRRYPDSPHTAEARFWRGVLQETAGRPEAAAAEYQSAIAASLAEEKEPLARLRLGVNLLRLQRFEEAAARVQEVLPTPTAREIPPALLEWLAEFRLNANQGEKALDAARLLTEPLLDPEWRQTGWVLVGRALALLGDEIGARKAFENALAEKVDTPARRNAHFLLAERLAANGAWAEAEPHYREACALSTDDHRLHAQATAGLARTLETLGRTEEAVPLFLKVALLYRDEALTPESLYRAAQGFRRIGRAHDADRLIEELRRDFPTSPWAAKAGEGEP